MNANQPSLSSVSAMPSRSAFALASQEGVGQPLIGAKSSFMAESDIWRIAGKLMPANAQLDDAFHQPATYEGEAVDQVFSTDVFVEGQHFEFSFCSPFHVGFRCLGASLSDLAACGAVPKQVLVGLSVPHTATVLEVDGFYKGIEACFHACQLSTTLLVGGDTVRGRCWMITFTVVGYAPWPMLRGHAKAGQLLVATGNHGMASHGLRVLKQMVPLERKQAEQSIKQFLMPVPRLFAGQIFAKSNQGGALMDSSDGLADACLKIAQASKVRVCLNQDWLPLHAELGLLPPETAQRRMLYGGEDFELVGTIDPDLWQRFWNTFLHYGFRVHGWVEAGAPEAILVKGASKTDYNTLYALDPSQTFQHFKGNER
jgi:thiamine-monophosphate kinase